MARFRDPGAALSSAQLRELDRRAIEEFGLPGVVLMENAGAGATAIALSWLADPATSVACVACGPGQNGGDGWVVARRLANAGCAVRVVTTVGLDALRGDAAVHARVAERMGIAHAVLDAADAAGRWPQFLDGADLVVDALLGTGSRGAPHGAVRIAIEALASLERAPRGPAILALDLPSGLDADTGERPGACVRADATATFAARKTGFEAPTAAAVLGRVEVVDLGVPRVLFERVRTSGAGIAGGPSPGGDQP